MFDIFVKEIFHASFPIESYIKNSEVQTCSPDFTQSRTGILVRCGQQTERTNLNFYTLETRSDEIFFHNT